MNDEELDEFIEGELKKDIDQSERVESTVGDAVGEMGWLWDRVNDKLTKDNVCFKTKKPLYTKDSKPPKIHIVEANAEPGVVAFVALSEEAYQEELAKQESKEETQAE